MQDPFKVAATGIIWIVVLLVLCSAIWAPVAGAAAISGGSLTLIAAVLGFAAAIGTGYVWRSGAAHLPTSNTSVEKAKRDQRDPRERLMRTLGALDDEEAAAMLEDLKAKLYGGDSDGEISAVDMLRQERRQRD
ncbi:MAG: hypothetical protein KF716_24270 [Anaerolineae bacterium]|nr:hypothetical protein [Anaerolineae bacterium]